MHPLIFSIAPKWIDEILHGRKTVELRRRPPTLAHVTRAYLYETSPSCRIRVRCWVGPVISQPPAVLWDRVGKQSCISKMQFDDYFLGLNLAHAIVIDRVEDLGLELTLARLRLSGFSPPQAWCRAAEGVTSMIEQAS
jgi:predicted transcriptional regulator